MRYTHEMHAREVHAREVHAITHITCTPIKYRLMRPMPVTCTPMRHTHMKCIAHSGLKGGHSGPKGGCPFAPERALRRR